MFKDRQIDPESCQIKPNLDCNYSFPIAMTTNGIIPRGVSFFDGR